MRTVKKAGLKKQIPLKRKYEKKNAAINIQPFEIETAPPSYRLNPDLANVLNRIEKTIKIMSPGQAFVVPGKSRHSIKKFIEQKWPLHQFVYSKIKDNPTMMRIYFVREAKG